MQSRSRLEQHEMAGVEPPLPPLPLGADYYLKAMMALGPIRPMAMGGVRAADWPEIMPFIQACCMIEPGWEASLLKNMCDAYAEGFSIGKNPLGIAPMDREGDR